MKKDSMYVKIMAAILAGMMVVSVLALTITYLIH
jgi:hypothetical protein